MKKKLEIHLINGKTWSTWCTNITIDKLPELFLHCTVICANCTFLFRAFFRHRMAPLNPSFNCENNISFIINMETSAVQNMFQPSGWDLTPFFLRSYLAKIEIEKTVETRAVEIRKFVLLSKQKNFKNFLNIVRITMIFWLNEEMKN